MIKVVKAKPDTFQGDLLVYLVAEGEKEKITVSTRYLKTILGPAWNSGDFNGAAGQTYVSYPEGAVTRVLVVGLGQWETEANGQREQLRLAAGTAAQFAREKKVVNAALVLPTVPEAVSVELGQPLSEGVILGGYRFLDYKTEENGEDTSLSTRWHFYTGSEGEKKNQLQAGIRQGAGDAEAACWARDLAQQPGNCLTAKDFCRHARHLAKRVDLTVKILKKKSLRKLEMGGILGVNQGSALPPALICLRYRSAKKNPTLLLVGKGLTFDSGGVSLKPAAGMEEMKYDMCGGGTVLATMAAVGRQRPKGVNVVALIPVTDNMSGAAALKPGDVIQHYGGKTSEVINTDAEGRLILADALAYGVEQYQPDAVVDLATLTGAVIVGLGHHHTGLLSNNDALVEQLTAAGAETSEPLWRLPLGKAYRQQLKSTIADLKNTGGKGGGTITAAAYLAEFVGQTPWAHLDIAGTAWNFTEKSYIPKGPSGTGVRTLLSFIRHWQSGSVSCQDASGHKK